MKLNLACKNILKLACLVAGLAISGSASAGLINGNFSDGFDGWSGDVIYYDALNDMDFNDLYDVNFANFSSNFSTVGNSVTLTTSADANNEYWDLSLFQEFVVAANSLELSLSFNSNVTPSDIASIVLFDENGDEAHDFVNGGSVYNISSLAGTSMLLNIILKDGDFVLGDYLTVSNISISKQSVPVPEPSSIAIFAFALFALKSRSIIRK